MLRKSPVTHELRVLTELPDNADTQGGIEALQCYGRVLTHTVRVLTVPGSCVDTLGTVARNKSRKNCLRAERLLLPACISVHHSLTHSQTHRAERTHRAGVLTAPLLAAIMLVSAAHAV